MGMEIPDLSEVEVYFCKCGMRFSSDVGISNHEERAGYGSHQMDAERQPTDADREWARDIIIKQAQARRR